jgi:hypothetical protein
MVFKSFAHKLLPFFGFILLSAIFTYVAMTGLLGEPPKNAILPIWENLIKFYSTNKESIDLALKVIGLSGSGLVSLFALYKGWYYAEESLPKRLEQYLVRANAALVSERHALIPSLADVSSLADLPSVVISQPPFKRLFDVLGLDPRGRKIKDIEDQIEPLSEQLAVLETKQRSCRTQKGTALFVRGLEIARTATHLGSNASDSREQNLRSYEAIRAASELDGDDLDALELTIKQAFALRMTSDALKFAKLMENKAETAGNNVLRGRALRFQAEILSSTSELRSWNEARRKAVAAIELLANIAGHDEIRVRELGRAQETLATIQIQREKLPSAATDLNRAKEIYGEIAEPWRSEGLARLDVLQQKLDNAMRS